MELPLPFWLFFTPTFFLPTRPSLPSFYPQLNSPFSHFLLPFLMKGKGPPPALIKAVQGHPLQGSPHTVPLRPPGFKFPLSLRVSPTPSRRDDHLGLCPLILHSSGTPRFLPPTLDSSSDSAVLIAPSPFAQPAPPLQPTSTQSPPPACLIPALSSSHPRLPTSKEREGPFFPPRVNPLGGGWGGPRMESRLRTGNPSP